jgi:ABC-type spermidine/putrescine transport system permease subunit II
MVGVFGELAFLAYLKNIYSMLNWQLIAGSLAIVIGILLIINLWIIKSTISKENKLIIYAAIINPGLVSVLAGITVIMRLNYKLAYIYNSTTILMVFGIIIGFGVFIAHIVKTKNK